jgi:hypothetical protein
MAARKRPETSDAKQPDKVSIERPLLCVFLTVSFFTEKGKACC